MLFLDKAIQATSNNNATEFAVEINTLNEDMIRAEAVAEAGDRYMALVAAEERAKMILNKISRRVQEQTKVSDAAILGPGPVSNTLAYVGAGVIFSAVVMIIGLPLGAIYAGLSLAMPGAFFQLLLGVAAVGFAVMGAGGIIGQLEANEVRRKITASANEISAKVSGISAKSSAQRAVMADQNIYDLAQSRRWDHICQKFPALSTAFAQKAIKEKRVDLTAAAPGVSVQP